VAGPPLAKPTPLFRKLDEKLAETGPSWAPITT
jgi:methionine--tRNA ligase